MFGKFCANDETSTRTPSFLAKAVPRIGFPELNIKFLGQTCGSVGTSQVSILGRRFDLAVFFTLPLFATGLGALGLFVWRRKGKKAAA
jgi:hypothetical protein